MGTPTRTSRSTTIAARPSATCLRCRATGWTTSTTSATTGAMSSSSRHAGRTAMRRRGASTALVAARRRTSAASRDTRSSGSCSPTRATPSTSTCSGGWASRTRASSMPPISTSRTRTPRSLRWRKVAHGMLATLPAAPTHERSLLELRAEWPGLPESHERVAARLRVFVLNWDPLGWHGPSQPRATATGDGDSFELVLYVPLEDVEVLGDLCRSVVELGVEQERLLASGAYAQLAATGKAADLLSATGALSNLGEPEFALAGDGWEPIGLGAIQDLVQAQFGPVDLDRARVALEPVAAPTPGCPACDGQRFGFPAELAEAQAAMCAPHADRSAAIIAERLRRAEASNRQGWRAIADAAGAPDQPPHAPP